MKIFLIVLLSLISVFPGGAADLFLHTYDIHEIDSIPEPYKQMVYTAAEISDWFGTEFDVLNNSYKIKIQGPYYYYSENTRIESVNQTGRAYYTIIFLPENSTDYEYGTDILSSCCIWANGSPQSVIFRGNYGRNFIFKTFEEQKSGSKGIFKVPENFKYRLRSNREKNPPMPPPPPLPSIWE